MNTEIFLKRILPIGLASIAVTFLYSWVGYAFVVKSTQFSLLDLWSGWDGQHYLEIVKQGYLPVGANAKNIVFFPLYPLVVGALDFFFDAPRFMALLVSNSCFLLALCWLYELVRLDFDERTALWSVIWMALFPTAYFLHAIYPESLFMALMLGAFLYFRRGKFWLGGALAMLACLARPQGVVLIPALAVESWSIWKTSRTRSLQPWLACGLGGVGVIVYLGMNYAVFGSLFKFMEFQRLGWSRQFAWPTVGLAMAWARLFSLGHSEALWSFWEIVAAAVGMLLLVVSRRRLRPSYTTYVALAWLLVVCNSFWLSQPRHLLCLFPLYICLALSVQRRCTKVAVAASFVVLQAYWLSEFNQWHWAF